MTNDAKRTSQLGIVTTLSANDRVVVLTNPASAAQTQTIPVSNFVNSAMQFIPVANGTSLGLISGGPGILISANGQLTAPLPLATSNSVGVVSVGNNISVNSAGAIAVNINGPYANDSAAAAGFVPVNGLYYTSNGTVHIRLS